MSVVVKDKAMSGLVDPGVDIEAVATGFSFTEGPVWHPNGYLLFSDIPNDARWKWSKQDGPIEVLNPANKCNGMALDSELRLLICEHSTSSLIRAHLDINGEEISREVLATHYRGQELNSPNDVVIRSDGGIYFTDPPYGRMKVYGKLRKQEMTLQGVYRIDPKSNELLLVADDFVMPNGICFSPDESILYINDSELCHVRAFDVTGDGLLINGRVLLDGIGTGNSADGIPDGMKCDTHGNIWVTGPRGLWVISPVGKHLGVIEIPEHVGNLAWGGRDWSELYIPSSTSVYRMQTRTSGALCGYMG